MKRRGVSFLVMNCRPAHTGMDFFGFLLLFSFLKSVLRIRIRSDPDLFAGSGKFDRIRIPCPDPDPTSLKVLIINQKR
jgi:hypothetical protein